MRRNRRDLIPFDLDARDVEYWTGYIDPVVLILFDGTTRDCFWLHVQAGTNPRPRSARSASIRVFVPPSQRVSESTIRHFQRLKRDAYALVPANKDAPDGTGRDIPKGFRLSD